MPNPLNGSFLPLLMWAINVLLGFVIALLGLVMKQHESRDDERHDMVLKEMGRLRDRAHDVGNRVSAIEVHVQWLDEDRKNDNHGGRQ